MTLILCASLIIIFALLSILHFSWALGNTWGFNKALPTNEAGVKMLNPGKFDCALVGVGLLAFASVYLYKIGLINFNIPNWLLSFVSWIIPAIFILRAIGDFKYVGFFKKIKYTEFGRLDSRFFSPLCLTIGIAGTLIEIIK